MNRYLGRILICTVPVLIGIAIIAWAADKYWRGEGGFRLGVDLVGGTTLVYEVDTSKMQGGKNSYRADEMTSALKRRIDPNDLLAVTIRSLQGDPPRVEVVLPTGGRHQSDIEDKAWRDLVAAVAAEPEYVPPEGKSYDDIAAGRDVELLDRIRSYHPNADMAKAQTFLKDHYAGPKGQRGLTHEGIEKIKALIAQQGRLEFRILANTTDDSDAIKQAEAYFADKNAVRKAELERLARDDQPPPGPRLPDGEPFTITVGGEQLRHFYSWVELGKGELYTMHLNSEAANDPKHKQFWDLVKSYRDKGDPLVLPAGYGGTMLYSREIPPEARLHLPTKDADKKYQYFMLTRDAELIRSPTGSYTPREITGKYLVGATPGTDNTGRLAVHFTFDAEGGNLFWELTSRNKPSGSGENFFHRRLAIVLDSMIQSAPSLNEPIRTNGQITGEFTQAEVDNLVRILRAGALPATIKSKPVSENTMGATLGEDTIRKGTWSVAIAFAAILLFMAVYYRFAGLVACFALLANLILTVAFMVVVDAAFTLPGLAGLVLMLGMAVDANVLIYERLREERERGANLALAIRNGYDRAFPTIIDTHMTSIFTAIVLYVVGNDQLKGFGISLTAGLIISLFTSLYVTRTIFDIWMGMGWLKNLTMMHLFRRPNFDFMAIRNYWFTATVVLTILGGGTFLWRLDKGGLNIDFVGGTLYSGQLNDYVSIDELRQQLKDCKVQDLSIELLFVRDYSEGNRSKLFTIRTPEKGDTERTLKNINESLEKDKRPGNEGRDLLKKIEFDWKAVPAAENKQAAELDFFNPALGHQPDYASIFRVKALLVQAFEDAGIKNPLIRIDPAGLSKEERYTKMRVEAESVISKADFEKALNKVQEEFRLQPQPDRLEVFDAQLARDTQTQALYAILASWIIILVYLWFRFGSWTFGAAAVVCLIHDLFFTLGGIALCHYLHEYAPGLATLLYVQDFKIDLPSVAALLTLVGYSVSDTIVVFDRIREVRGKNPALTPQMINDSVNQTLSRTVLSAVSVWLVVTVLYWLGGEGVHLFAFVMVIGVIVGTYSSIYIASPLLLIFGEGQSARARAAAVPQEVAPRV
jgi:SecD/SecF fusion protein